MPRIERPARAAGLASLLSVHEVAALLGCSARTVQRLSEKGRMPLPVKLATLIRWRRADVEEWVESGCPIDVGHSGHDRIRLRQDARGSAAATNR